MIKDKSIKNLRVARLVSSTHGIYTLALVAPILCNFSAGGKMDLGKKLNI